MFKPIFKRSEYVPRHARFEAQPQVNPVYTREITENVPLLSEEGEVVATSQRVVVVPCSECIGKYKESDFRVKNLVDAGVPLSKVQITSPAESVQDFIDYVSGRIDDIQNIMVKPASESVKPQPNPTVTNPSEPNA